MKLWQTAVCIVVFFSGTLPLWAQSRVRTFESDVGRYQLATLEEIHDPFEITDSLQFGVLAQSRTDTTDRVFRSFKLDAPREVLAEIPARGVQAWCVIGEQLVVAAHGALQFRQLPDLRLVTETRLSGPGDIEQLDTPIALSLAAAVNPDQNVLLVNDIQPLKQAGLPLSIQVDDETMRVTGIDEFRKAILVERVAGRPHSVSARVVAGRGGTEPLIRRVPGGWYCDGYVFDNSGNKIVCIFYFRSAKPAQNALDPIIHSNFKNIPTSSDSDISLACIAGRLTASEGSHHLLKLSVRSFDPVESFVDQLPLVHAGLGRREELREARVDEQDCTFLCGNRGYLVRIDQFDAFLADFPSPLRFRFFQPAMTIDADHTVANLRFVERPGPEIPPAVAALPTRQSIEEQTRQFFQQRSDFSLRSLHEFKEQLQEYSEKTKVEFNNSVGRQANGIPVPYWITARFNWQNAQLPSNEFRYCVWAEWTERAILDLLFREETAQRRLAEQKLEEQNRERLRQEEERRRAEIARQLEEERLKLKRARNEKAIEASFSVRLVWSTVLAVLAGIVLGAYRLMRRDPAKASDLVQASSLFLFALSSPLTFGQETVSAKDGDAFVMQLPFPASHLYLSADEKWAVIRRDGAVAVGGKSTSALAAVDLERRQVTAECRLDEQPQQLFLGSDFIVMNLPSSGTLVCYSLRNLTQVAARRMTSDTTITAFIDQRFVQLSSHERWDVPSLQDSTGDWAADLSLEGWGERGRVYSTEGKWFIDGFHYSSDLQQPLAFCGHPRMFQSVVMNASRSQASPTSDFDARPLAPFLKTLQTFQLTDQHNLFQIVAPLSFPQADAIASAGSSDPEHLKTSKPQLWVRLQAVLPETQRSAKALPSQRLLAKIRVDLPGMEVQDLYARDLHVPMSVSQGRCIAAIQKNLLIFTLNAAALQRLPKLPRLVDRCLPVIIDDEGKTAVEAQLTTGVAIERITGSFGTTRIESASAGFELEPAEVLNRFQIEQLFAGVNQTVRTSPRATFDEWVSAFRQRQLPVIARLESLAGRTITGLPLSVPLRLELTAADESIVEVGRCIVIDLSPEPFRGLFDQAQARRLARLSPPQQPTGVGEKITSPIDINSTEAVLMPTPPISVAASPRRNESDEPPDATEPEVSSPLFEIASNLLFSTLLAGVLLPISFRLYRRGLPADETFVVPSWYQVLVLAFAICLLVVAAESLLVIWGRKCVQLDGWPTWFAAMIVVFLALSIRFVTVIVGMITLLRLAVSEVAEIMLFLTLLAFVPTVLFLFVFVFLAIAG